MSTRKTRRSLGAIASLCVYSLLAISSQPGPASAADWHSFDGAPDGPARVQVVESDRTHVLLDVTVPGVLVEETVLGGTRHRRVSLPSCERTGDIGFPELPEVRMMLAIPGDSGVGAEVIETTTVELPGLPVYPAQPPTSDGGPPTGGGRHSAVRDEAFYRGTAAYPQAMVTVLAPETWRDVRVARLLLRPFSYNAATGVLSGARRMLVSVRFDGSDSRNTVRYDRHRLLAAWDRRYRSSLVNYEAFAEPVGPAQNPGSDLLVIAPDALCDSVATLADWHDREGLRTELVRLSTIGTTTDQIKAYIAGRYAADNISAVLLAGDVSLLPIRILPTGADTNTPSDHWYACLGGSGDYIADIDIARLSATTGSAIAHQVRKILAYEITPPVDDWTARSILCANERADYIQCKEDIRLFPYHGAAPPVFEKCYAVQGGTKAQLIAALERGVGLVNYRGHGLQTQWWWQPGWNTTDIHTLQNGEHYPLVFNICCDNGWLDQAEETLAEAWMSAAHGAAGNLAATRSSWTDPNHVFDRELYKAIYDSCFFGTVEAVNLARNRMMFDALGRDNGQMYVWLGDPVMQIRTAAPRAIAVSHPGLAYPRMPDFTVTATRAGNPLAGARVCLRSTTRDCYEVGVTGPAGIATFALGEVAVGQDLQVTVTAQDAVPYLGAVSIGFVPSTVESVETPPNPLTDEIVLEPNAPNPVRSGTTIRFALPAAMPITLTVYDVRGRAVRTLAAGLQDAGQHSTAWDGRDARGIQLEPGIYFYRLVTGKGTCERSMVLLK